MQATPRSTQVLAVGAAVLFIIALILELQGSFAFLGFASLGLFALAGVLISRRVSSQQRRPAILALIGVALTLFGTTATPLFYVGCATLAASALLALLAGHFALESRLVPLARLELPARAPTMTQSCRPLPPLRHPLHTPMNSVQRELNAPIEA
jgi:hypothetical protein